MKTIDATAVDWPGGAGTFCVYGTWAGSTAKLQFSPDLGTNWIDVGSDVTFTADNVGNFQLPQCKIRLNVSGGGTLVAKYDQIFDRMRTE